MADQVIVQLTRIANALETIANGYVPVTVSESTEGLVDVSNWPNLYRDTARNTLRHLIPHCVCTYDGKGNVMDADCEREIRRAESAGKTVAYRTSGLDSSI